MEEIKEEDDCTAPSPFESPYGNIPKFAKIKQMNDVQQLSVKTENKFPSWCSLFGIAHNEFDEHAESSMRSNY